MDHDEGTDPKSELTTAASPVDAVGQTIVGYRVAQKLGAQRSKTVLFMGYKHEVYVY